MKKIILLFGMTLCVYNAIAQLETIFISIPRDNYNNIIIKDSNNDTIFLTKENENRVIKMDMTYTIIAGKGRKKDYKGEREKNKNYLVNSKGDTLLTLRESQKIIEFKDSTYFFMKRTQNGWEIHDSKDSTVCEIELLWNDSIWQYEIKYYKLNKNIEDLKKFNYLNLVNLAYYRSACNCDSNNDIWFIMYASTLGN